MSLIIYFSYSWLYTVIWSFPGLRACSWSAWSQAVKPSRSDSSRKMTASSESIRETFATYASNSKLQSALKNRSHVWTCFSTHTRCSLDRFTLSEFRTRSLRWCLETLSVLPQSTELLLRLEGDVSTSQSHLNRNITFWFPVTGLKDLQVTS